MRHLNHPVIMIILGFLFLLAFCFGALYMVTKHPPTPPQYLDITPRAEQTENDISYHEYVQDYYKDWLGIKE